MTGIPPTVRVGDTVHCTAGDVCFAAIVTDIATAGLCLTYFASDAGPRTLVGIPHHPGGDMYPDGTWHELHEPRTPASTEQCCACGSASVVYHNYREQPFCARCANGGGAA